MESSGITGVETCAFLVNMALRKLGQRVSTAPHDHRMPLAMLRPGNFRLNNIPSEDIYSHGLC